MKKFFILVVSIYLFLTSCSTTNSSNSNGQSGEPILYTCVTETEEYRDIAVIGLMNKNETEGMFSYSVDRYKENSAGTIAFEMGSYTILGEEISFVSDGFNYIGTILNNGIMVEDNFFMVKQ